MVTITLVSEAAGDTLDGGMSSVVFWVFVFVALMAAFVLGHVLHRR